MNSRARAICWTAICYGDLGVIVGSCWFATSLLVLRACLTAVCVVAGYWFLDSRREVRRRLAAEMLNRQCNMCAGRQCATCNHYACYSPEECLTCGGRCTPHVDQLTLRRAQRRWN